MQSPAETLHELAAIPNLIVSKNVPLCRHTRFGIGGPAAFFVETPSEEAFASAMKVVRQSGLRSVVIGCGSNLIAADRGFDGFVLRYIGRAILAETGVVNAQAGAELQTLVDATIARGLAGIETMTGIPGSVGAAVYGNAGAYGHSISEFVRQVRFFDGERIRELDGPGCEFRYRESIFKRRKGRIILAVRLELKPGERAELEETARAIREIRDRKYPPGMRCAGSIFKNLLLEELSPAVARQVPEAVVRGGKVPAAWFLEQAGAKGMRRGDIQVAPYHANLLYNDGEGTAADLTGLIDELKNRVRDRFGLDLEEEVQYVG